MELLNRSSFGNKILKIQIDFNKIYICSFQFVKLKFLLVGNCTVLSQFLEKLYLFTSPCLNGLILSLNLCYISKSVITAKFLSHCDIRLLGIPISKSNCVLFMADNSTPTSNSFIFTCNNFWTKLADWTGWMVEMSFTNIKPFWFNFFFYRNWLSTSLPLSSSSGWWWRQLYQRDVGCRSASL